jgi:hypothetical protein
MNKIPLRSIDNNNVQATKKFRKNIIIKKNSPFGYLIKNIKTMVNTDRYNSILIKTFL